MSPLAFSVSRFGLVTPLARDKLMPCPSETLGDSAGGGSSGCLWPPRRPGSHAARARQSHHLDLNQR